MKTETRMITGGKAGMSTDRRRGRYISVEVRLYPEKEPDTIDGWSRAINQAVYDVIDCCAKGMMVHNASDRKDIPL